MTKERHYELYHVDAFTRNAFEGNSAGVVLEAEGLSTAEMQSIAADLRHSETAFVFGPDADDHDVHVRFFTPSVEVPSCGHATLAVHYVRAKQRGLSSGSFRQKCGAGILRIDVGSDGDDVRIRMHQKKPVFERELSLPETEAVLRALGMDPGERRPDCPVEIVDTGHSKVLIGATSTTVLNRLTPDNRTLAALSKEIGSNGFHVFTLDTDREGFLTECRMFAPAIGITEDPVTGNGNGPLGAYFVRHALARHDGRFLRFDSLQGRAMGRPGVATVEVKINAGEPVDVAVVGSARIVYEANLVL